MEREKTIIPAAQFAALRGLKQRGDAVDEIFPQIKAKLLPPKWVRQIDKIVRRKWEEWDRREYLDEMNA